MDIVPAAPEPSSGIEQQSETQAKKTASAPLGLWLCPPAPADEHGLPPLIEGLTRSLVTRAVTALAAPGDTIAVTGPDAARITAVTDSVGDRRVLCINPETVTAEGCRRRTGGGARTPEDGSVDLLLAAELPSPWIDSDGQPYRSWAGWLAPDGVLAVALHDEAGRGRFADYASAVTTAATNAGMRYARHIIVTLAPVERDRLLRSRPQASVTVPAEAVHASKRTDLLIFRNDSGAALTQADRSIPQHAPEPIPRMRRESSPAIEAR
ncbi:hypothetical protein [Amycolatopsis sp. Poz14]|uniref:hypothetical protein n=1 Tax=Amycolatopsis sp. Poz14 TaxID=1447705 RepID=UPI001EE852ED|nr:hypothetical protein [Amycolatopsis sp. Poz14]MCG3755859.1 hypothetical protein [Amycolatopsis sp. Poz14]